MKSRDIRKQIDDINQELEKIHVISDDEITALVASGQDAETLINQASDADKRRRVLLIQLSGLRSQLSTIVKSEANSTITSLKKERDENIKSAKQALIDARKAVEQLAVALDGWQQSAVSAHSIGLQINNAALEAGIKEPLPFPGIGSGEFYTLENRLVNLLRPYRVDGSQLGKQQVTLED